MNSKFSFGRVKILADCNVEGLQTDALKYVVPKVRVEFTMHNKTYTLTEMSATELKALLNEIKALKKRAKEHDFVRTPPTII